MRVCWPGVITRISVAPANTPELSVVPELVEHTWGVVVGDRNYWSPPVREKLSGRGVELLAPYRTKQHDPNPGRSAFLSCLRYRIDTVFSQLTERYCVKRVWARDLWHLASRLLRKVLSTPLPSCSTIGWAIHPFSSRSCLFDKLAHRVS